MDIIRQDELGKCASGGLFTSLYIHKISVPVVLHFGTDEQKEMFKPVVRGEKIAALAISEPGHGSDVAGLTTTAKRDETGKFFIVNGMKKWISNGVWCTSNPFRFAHGQILRVSVHINRLKLITL